ncbi:MAG: hypothetical protein ABJ350_18095 [Anderseniella sp.]
MSNNENNARNGFKNSRIDLSQLGDDNWNKPLSGNPATPGPRRKAPALVASAGSRGRHLDDLFESRVHAATARRAAKQKKGESGVWLFAGGLFLASVSGIAAAYYLVGPPMAMSAYGPDVAGYQATQTTSLESDSNIAGTSSHFQGVPVSVTMPASTTESASDAPVMAQPSAGVQSDTDIVTETVARDPVAPTISTEPVAADEVVAVENQPAQPQENEVAAVAAPEAPVDIVPKTEAVQTESERMVRIVPTAVSEEIETKTNVNTAKAPDASAGQWVAVPTETKPVAPSEVAAATQQSGETKPVAGPVKSQQELFKEFQEYLESSGHTAVGDNEGQEELFNKFIRWSVEAPKEN